MGWVEPDYALIEGFEADAEVSCDGLDNDCDGNTDEELAAPDAARTEGVCAGQVQLCAGEDGWVEPDYNAIEGYEAEDEVSCDGRDNDCDGDTDEDAEGQALAQACYTGAEGTEGVGACAGGVSTCTEGSYGVCEGEVIPVDEVCDGVDNDCNGEMDEGLEAPKASLSAGVCLGLVQTCEGADGWLDPDFTAVEGYEQSEVSCDGKDNDCDGTVDNGLEAPPAVLTEGQCADSVKVCDGENGWVEPDYSTTVDVYEEDEGECDNVDNDCDGTVDEGCPPGNNGVNNGEANNGVGSSADENTNDDGCACDVGHGREGGSPLWLLTALIALPLLRRAVR